MKKILMSLVLVLGFFCANGQETAKKSLFYQTDGYKLSRKQKSELSKFLDSALQRGKVANIILVQAHTDSAASMNYNIKLSQRRSGEVQKFITNKKIGKVKIEVKNFGETRPRYKYLHPDAMAKNRRVDIEIQYEITPNISENISSKTTIIDLYKLLETAADTFYINNNFDTILRAKNGIIVNIPANTICVRENKNELVKVAIKEVLNIPNMISQNASTGSGTNYLITGGMLQITAFTLRNKPLQICDNNSFTVLVPTDNPDADMQLFYASRDKDYALDWELQNPDEKLDIINGSVFQKCYYPKNGNNNGGAGGGRCRLFFCKIRNAVSNVCRKIYSRKTYASRNKKQTKAYKFYQKRNMAMELEDLCTDRKNKLAEIEAKFEGISAGRMENLTDAEMNYYIFKTTKMGWTNCDRFMSLKPDQLAQIILPLKSASTTDVKLILSKERSILPSYDMDGKIGFPNVPKGEKATILGMRYQNGQPSLAFKEITIGEEGNELNLEFKDCSLDELKKILAKL